jgi:hypothetical protein
MKKIENFLNVDEIINDRQKDIDKRGATCPVINYNGEVVHLEKAVIWYNNNGDYIEPRIYIPNEDDKKCEESENKNLKELDDSKEEEICEIMLNTIYNNCTII